MAVYFNNSGSTEVSTFNFNGTPLTSATFNGPNEVFGDWVEYEFPTNSTHLSASSGNGALGFTFNYSTPISWANSNAGELWYPLGYITDSNKELKLGFADGGSLKTFWWALQLPTDWGSAKVKSVKIANAKNFHVYRIDGAKSRIAYNSIDNTYDQSALLPCHIFDIDNGDHTSDYSTNGFVTSSDFTPVSVLKILGTKASSINGNDLNQPDVYGFIGKITFTFIVSKSKLKAWATKYSVMLPQNIT